MDPKHRRCGRTLEAAPRPFVEKWKEKMLGESLVALPPLPNTHWPPPVEPGCSATSLPAFLSFAGELRREEEEEETARPLSSPAPPQLLQSHQRNQWEGPSLRNTHWQLYRISITEFLSPSPRSTCLHNRHRQEKVRLLTSCRSLKLKIWGQFVC